MLRITITRCIVYPSLVRFPLPLPSQLFFFLLSLLLWEFHWLSGSSFGALTPSGLSSTSCFCLFSYRVFCITCASFWLSGFLGFPSGVSRPLSALVYLFHGGPLLHFELLATRLLPSSFIFLYTFSSILLPSPGFQAALHLLFFLFISSFEFSTFVVPSLGAVTCAWCICILAISPVPHTLPGGAF